MTVQTYIFADVADVETVLGRLDTALSPIALAQFLTGKVAPFLGARAKERFRSEGDAASGNWQELTPHTQSVRAAGALQYGWAIGPAHPINKRTGELEDYITSGQGVTIPWQAGSSLIYPDPAQQSGELATKVKTAQRGKANPKTPARPVLAVNETDLRFILEALGTHIIVGAGGRPL